MDHVGNAVRFHVKRDCDLIVHPVPRIDQGTLVLRVQVLAFLGELLGVSVDEIDQSYDIFPAAVNDDVRKCSLALVTVLDPAAVIDRKLVDQGDCFLLRSNRSDPADLSLIIERHVYVLGPCYKERLKNIVLLRFLFEKTDEVEAYRERFLRLIDSLRKDLDAENVPVILGELPQQIGPGWKTEDREKRLNEILRGLALEIPYCAIASSVGISVKPDGVHFDSQGCREFGQRYFDQYLSLV